MKIDFFHWQSFGGWSVIVDNEVIGSIEHDMWSSLIFIPRIVVDSNFSAAQHLEIQNAVADFITAQRITQRLTS